MIEEIIDRETNLKNEVVAAYSEVLRKLKVTNRLNEETDLSEKKISLQSFESKEIPAVTTTEHFDKNNINKNLSDLRQYFLTSLNTLEETLLAEQKKISVFENEVAEKIRSFEKEEQDYIATRGLQREKQQISDEAARQTEEREYIYQRDLRREKDRNQYEITKRDLEMELKDHETKMLAREEEYLRIKEKESWILTREKEYYLLKEKVEQFPEELKRSIEKAEKNITEHLALKYEYEIKLFQMEMEAERKLHQQTIAALEAKIAHLESLKYSFNKLAFNSMETTM